MTPTGTAASPPTAKPTGLATSPPAVTPTGMAASPTAVTPTGSDALSAARARAPAAVSGELSQASPPAPSHRSIIRPRPSRGPASSTNGGALTRVVTPMVATKNKHKRGSDGAAGAAPATRHTTRRRPACGRQAFNAGKVDVDAFNPHLLDAVGELDKDGRRELLSFVNAINIDSVILPLRPHLAGTLRALAGLLDKKDDGAGIREVLGMATSTAAVPVVEEDNSKKPIVELLRDMRFMQLGVPACASLFKTMPMLSAALARCLSSVANAVDKFVLEWCKGPDATQEYQEKWECGKRLQEEMCNDVKATYLQAATSHERTGTCAPALLQC